MQTCSQTSKRKRDWAVLEIMYGSEAQQVWTDQPPSPSDVSEWLREQRKSWSVRTYPKGATINEVTRWAREQGLKRLDWDFIPKQHIWFRDPQVAMIWDLSGPQSKIEKPVDYQQDI